MGGGEEGDGDMRWQSRILLHQEIGAHGLLITMKA